MLVLDEQLLGRDIERALRRWYRGSVLFVTDLRPGTVIKDEAIPSLLRQQTQATFLTINEVDFWGKVAINDRFCAVCLVVPDSQVRAIPALLRAVFRLAPFRSKARRMGKVLRVTRRCELLHVQRSRDPGPAPYHQVSTPKGTALRERSM